MYHAIILFHPLNYILTFGFNSVSHTTMASYGVPCRAVLCCGVPSHGMQWHRVAWKVLSWLDKPCSRMVLPWYSVASYDVTWLAILWSAVPWRTMACHVLAGPGVAWLRRAMSYHVVAGPVVAWHTVMWRYVVPWLAVLWRFATAACHLLVCLCLVAVGSVSGA